MNRPTESSESSMSRIEVGFHVGPAVLRGASLDEQWHSHLEQVRAARDCGFGFTSIGMHFVVDPFQYFSLIPWLARTAAEVPDLAVVAGVFLLPLCDPVDVAEEVATLDIVSEGQLKFGCGLGYRPIEFEVANVRLSERAARFEEGLHLIRRLWSEDVVNHKGRFYELINARAGIRPVQRPGPPVWIATNSDGATRRAARMGDAPFWSPFQGFDVLGRQYAIYEEVRRESGLPMPQESAIAREFSVARTKRLALEDAREGMEKKWRVYAQHGLQDSLPKSDKELVGDFEEMSSDTFIIGEPGACAEEIHRYADAYGITHFALRLPYPGMSQEKVMERILLSKEVIDRL